MQMILGPTPGPLDDDAVVAAYPWPLPETGGRWVRAMMVTTLDGAAAGPDGLSGSISSAVDKAVFDAVRRHADAVLVGAGTLRAEQYGPMRARPDDAAARSLAGQAVAPRLCIVSGSLDLDWSAPVFSESALTPLVVSGASPDAARLATAERHVEVARTDGERPDAASILAILEERGLRRVVCEGGPTLLESLVAAGLLDEADITLSPTFAGTAETPRTPGLDAVVGLELRHVLSAESFLMNRYVRAGA